MVTYVCVKEPHSRKYDSVCLGQPKRSRPSESSLGIASPASVIFLSTTSYSEKRVALEIYTHQLVAGRSVCGIGSLFDWLLLVAQDWLEVFGRGCWHCEWIELGVARTEKNRNLGGCHRS